MRREVLLPFVVAFFVSVAVSLCSAGVVYAENSTSAEGRLEEFREKRQEIRDQHKEKRETVRENVSAKRGDIREKIATKQAELRQRTVAKIKCVFSKILARLNAALARLDKIAQ